MIGLQKIIMCHGLRLSEKYVTLMIYISYGNIRAKLHAVLTSGHWNIY